jgi:ribosomal protein S18 acetylase RimI-like enzyme
MSADDLNWRVEALCTAARPALHRETVEGWAMGRTGGRMRQANCVNPLKGPRGDPAAAIERGEAFYERCGQPALFRVPTIAGEMDAGLDRLDYGVEGLTATLLNPLELPATQEAGTELRAEPWDAWLAVRQRTSGDAPADHEAYRKMVSSVALPKVFAATFVEGTPASIAYGVVGDGLLAVEGVATDADFRGQGLARKTLHTLIAWSRGQGARAACLQVQMDNAPALALYASLGFARELYRYHYRRRPA